MAVLLADVSEFQSDVNDPVYLQWSKAVIFRGLYGTRVDKAWYGGQRRELFHSGGAVFVGIYAYITADESVVAQARALLGLIGSLRPGEKLIADLEEGDGVQTQRWRAWAGVIESATGVRPWCYSGLDFAREHGLTPEWLADYSGTEPGSPPHLLWQFTDAYEVPGVGVCDCSRYNGTLEELAALAYQPGGVPVPAKPAPAPAPKPTPAVPADWQAKALAALPEITLGAPAGQAPYVRRAQALCDALGDPCGIDGQFGPATQTAVKAFQANHGLNPSGVVDAGTWALLATAGKPLPDLKAGAKDTREPWMVRRGQGLLNAAGHPVAIDGIFGPATETAVKLFQGGRGLTADGTIGPLTWSALITGKDA